MTTTTTKNITKRQAEQVLAAVKRQCASWCKDESGKPTGAQPELRQDWDWTGSGYGAKWSIVWEEGPYEWAVLFPYGGRDQEFGFRLDDVSASVPAGFYCEAITSWAIGIYPI